ncbi:MAG: SufD family Fe-S cluster assembly protein [Candidatus Buchananbacteria bacterium]|nr:SufD family Fe-S cluster assembly protein [Candidatus Buchananbacteria bacterium]
MQNKFKNILNKISALEKDLAFNKEVLGWPWPELTVKKTSLKKIKLADFLAGFADLKKLYSQGVKIRSALLPDYQKIYAFLETAYPFYSKIELLQALNSKSDIVIDIPKNSQINISYKNPVFSFWGNVYFFIGSGSSVSILDRHLTPDKFSAGSVYLLSGDNSQVEYLSLAGQSSYNFNLRSYPGRSSVHRLYAVGKMPEKYYYYNIMSFLKNNDCQNYILSSLSFLNNSKSIIKLQNNHMAKNTTGDIKFKGIGWDNSYSKVDGLIKIYKLAFKTDSYLKEDIILASDNSYSKAEPNLEILNNDVKASHGATIGHMDKNALFYLMSRGLSKARAEKLIADGFLKSLSKNILNQELKNEFEKYWL